MAGAESCVCCVPTGAHTKAPDTGLMHLCPAITHGCLCWPISVTSSKLASAGYEHVCDSTYEREYMCSEEGEFRDMSLCVFSKCLAFFKMA